MFHYSIHDSPILSQIILSTPPFCFLNFHFNIMLPSTSRFQVKPFRQVSPTIVLYVSLLCPIRGTCPTHLFLLELITRKMFGN